MPIEKVFLEHDAHPGSSATPSITNLDCARAGNRANAVLDSNAVESIEARLRAEITPKIPEAIEALRTIMKENPIRQYAQAVLAILPFDPADGSQQSAANLEVKRRFSNEIVETAQPIDGCNLTLGWGLAEHGYTLVLSATKSKQAIN